METRARYLLVGLFSLSVLAGGLGFVYWLHNTGGLRGRALYLVRFDGAVGGLRAGSAVLFNGIRVGEVTSLSLSAEDPRSVIATIAVQGGTPIRADTSVAIESQGLMGAPTIALQGGTPEAPPLVGTQNHRGLLVADRSGTEDISHAARDVLRLIRGVVADNAEPLRSTIGNLNTFTAALARNSDRLDGILQGVERLTGGGSDNKPVPVYDIAFMDPLPSLKKPRGLLVVPEPTALVVFDTQKILIRHAAAGTVPFGNAQWSDSLPKLLQAKVIQAFEHAGLEGAVSRPLDGVTANHQLLLDIRAFEVSGDASSEADVGLSAKILTNEGKIAASRIFRATAPVLTSDPFGAAAGLSKAFGEVMVKMLPWAEDVIGSGDDAGP